MTDLPERARELAENIRATCISKNGSGVLGYCYASSDASALILAFGQAERARTIEECKGLLEKAFEGRWVVQDMLDTLDALKERKDG
jgi:hypothetical protein